MIDTKAYLCRIGLAADTPVTHTESFLRQLQHRHVLTVPYENLDILAGKPLSLDTAALFDKIVTRRRGGYCFELNALLGAWLEELGFPVKRYFARYLRGETEIPVRRHHVFTAEAEGALFVMDVGIGQTAPRYPLRLTEGLEQPQGAECYRFSRDEQLGWVLWERHQGTWRRYFSFTDDVALPQDFIQPSFYCERHPDSPFWRDVMVAIKTPAGRRALNGRDYTEYSGGETVAHEENVDDVRRAQLLREKFGIVL